MRATTLRIQPRVRPLQQRRPRNYRAARYRYRYRYFARARRGKMPRRGPILAMIPLASRPPASVCRAPGRGELFARRKPQTLPLGGYEQCNNSTQCWVWQPHLPAGIRPHARSLVVMGGRFRVQRDRSYPLQDSRPPPSLPKRAAAARSGIHVFYVSFAPRIRTNLCARDAPERSEGLTAHASPSPNRRPGWYPSQIYRAPGTSHGISRTRKPTRVHQALVSVNNR